MSQLLAMCCDIAAFCQWFAPLSMQRLLQDGQRHRRRQRPFALSERMTSIVCFHSSHCRDCKQYSTEDVEAHLRPYFPALGSASRFVELMPRALGPLCGYLYTRTGRCTGIPGVAATSLAVCHNRRIGRPKGCEGDATRGTSSMGWFFGLQRPLRVNAEGELLAWRVTPAEGDDKVPLHRMPTGLWGHLFGDCGDLSRALHQALGAQGLGVIPLSRRNMKPRLRRVWDRRRLRQRFLREPLNDQVKNLSQIEHSRHCRLRGFRGHLVGGLMAYTFQPTKPSVGLRYGASVLPVVM